ncbi:MAG TPA: SDR family oxidoreductase [Bacteroidales bacterium]|nr:SDR family oxidoreductase [Bacteroidales bacterium]
MTGLNNKNIVITGASSGLGRQIAVEASRCGANVILVARNVERLQQTMELLDKGNHSIHSVDLNQSDLFEKLVDEMVANCGPVYGFVHSAGIEATIPFRNMKPSIYEDLFRVNVIAGFELARILSKKKNCEAQGGSFVFLGSVMGILGKEGKVAYCASKSALISGVKAMALELSSKKIRCNTVLPGMIMTEMAEEMFRTLPQSSVDNIISSHPLGLGKPSDVANLVTFLLSDKSSWITGSDFVIDGGYSAG